MTPEEILRRLAEQSAIFCFTEEVKDEKGRVIEKSQRITHQMVKEAVNSILGEKE